MKLDPAGHRQQKVWIPSAATASAAVVAALCGQPLAAGLLGGATAVMAAAIWLVARSERKASSRRVKRYLAGRRRRRPGVNEQVCTLIANLDETPKASRGASAWTERVRRLGGGLKAECVAAPVTEDAPQPRYRTSRRVRRLLSGAWEEDCSTR
jgi:hypothetical protein